MNKKIIVIILVSLAVYGLFAGLVITFYDDSPANMQWEDREAFNQQFIAKLALEQFDFDSALEQLGSPDITEAKKVDNIHYQITFYRTQHKKSDGFTTQDECTALLFTNNILTAVGDAAYEKFKAL